MLTAACTPRDASGKLEEQIATVMCKGLTAAVHKRVAAFAITCSLCSSLKVYTIAWSDAQSLVDRSQSCHGRVHKHRSSYYASQLQRVQYGSANDAVAGHRLCARLQT